MRLLTLCLLFISLSLTAQDNKAGIQFEHKAFDELLAQAKAEDKLIFVDAYTTWCGPCKMMSAKVFPQESVGKVYNARFVNAKIDMEKGEGPDLMKRYSVAAFPTYLFINGDGELVHKGLGYIPAEALLELADAATSDQSLLALGKRYEAGERDAEFMGSYAQVLSSVYEKEKADMVLNVFLDSKKDWSDEATMQLIASNPGEVGGKRFKFMIDNAEKFAEMTSNFELIGNLQNTFITNYMKENKSRKLPTPDEMMKVYQKDAGKLAGRLHGHYQTIYYEREETEKYPAAVMKYYKQFPSDNAMELNGLAWGFYEKVDDPKMLKVAIEWAKKSVDMEKGYANMDTLAWLYEKSGDKKMAKQTAKEAIEIAKANGEDYSGTAPILEN